MNSCGYYNKKFLKVKLFIIFTGFPLLFYLFLYNHYVNFAPTYLVAERRTPPHLVDICYIYLHFPSKAVIYVTWPLLPGKRGIFLPGIDFFSELCYISGSEKL